MCDNGSSSSGHAPAAPERPAWVRHSLAAIATVGRWIPPLAPWLLTPELWRTGWLRSFVLEAPCDAKGEPLPWWTYAAIHVLAQRMPADAEVFEFGSGQSTLWWAKRVAQVTACEHDRAWIQRLESRLPTNARLIHAHSDDDAYIHAAANTGRRYDLILIDGKRRVDCGINCLGALSERGVIVWDDFELEKYQPGGEFLRRQGFRQLDLLGLGPGKLRHCITTIFYREHNCLGL